MTVPPTLPLHGGCHCKALRFTLTAAPVDVYACHCTDCQKLSGSAFGIGVVVPEQAFTLTGTPRSIQRVLGSGRTGTRWTCPECGVWIGGNPRPDPNTGVVIRVIRGGTFDDTSWIRPRMHVWTRSSQRWFKFPEDARTFPMNAS